MPFIPLHLDLSAWFTSQKATQNTRRFQGEIEWSARCSWTPERSLFATSSIDRRGAVQISTLQSSSMFRYLRCCHISFSSVRNEPFQDRRCAAKFLRDSASTDQMNDLQLQLQLRKYTIKSSFSGPPSSEEPFLSPHTFQAQPRVFLSTHWYTSSHVMKTSTQLPTHPPIRAPP